MMTAIVAKRYYQNNSILRIPAASGLLCNRRMDASDVRLAHLIELLSQYGTIERLAEETESNAAHLSQIKNRTRRMGAAVARRFERKLLKPHGWMDTIDHAVPLSVLRPDTLQDNFRALPPAFQDRIADHISELRRLWEAVPDAMRPLIAEPPKDAEGYRVWVMNLRNLVDSMSKPAP
jgi:hypothetical protein